MSDVVRSRLNYYEVLRVSPTAGGDEIARAFAREGSVFRPHAFGGLTELCIAYETLRDPVSRRAYDASLRYERGQNPLNRSIGARMERAAVVEAKPAPVQHQVIGASPPPASSVKPAMSPHPLAALMSPPATKPALALGSGIDLHARPERRLVRGDPPSPSIEDYLGVEVRPLEWKRGAIIAGAVIAGACLLGGAAGWWSSGEAGELLQPENTVSVSLAPAKAMPALPAPQPTPKPVQTVPSSRLDRPKIKLKASTPVERPATVSQPTVIDEPPEPIGADAGTIVEAVEEVPADSAVSAAMPLPNRVIARTIERIGYACGRVASTVPAEGEAPGVYKVTCSSGQSYQARPVNGRYRFKRLDKR